MSDFEEIYDRHYQRIFNYCYKRIGNFETAKDITAQTFLKVYLNLNKFKFNGVPVISWIYKIATNEVNLFYRTREYVPSLLLDTYGEWRNEPSVELDCERERAEQELLRHKEFLSLQQAIRRLPIKYQEVITLRYFEKMSVREIGQVLNKKEGTIKSLLSRGVVKLKAMLL